MINRLTIKNIALIDSAIINFTDGLNVLSGETGAGKSVILESLNFVLGAKADKTLIRTGNNECMVTAEFELEENSPVYDVFNEFDMESEDVLIISRKLNSDGKSSIKVNGNSVSASMLKKFTAYLVDVHGQSEHFYLLKNSNQLKLLDKYCGAELLNIKSEIKNKVAEYKDVKSKLNDLGGDESSRILKLELLNYQIDEIKKVDLKDGEEESLTELKTKINNSAKIVNALNTARDILSGESGVGDLIYNAERTLGAITSFGEEYSEVYDRLSSVSADLEDVSETCEKLAEKFEFDVDIESVESRLDEIKALKRKYGANYSEISEFLSKAEKDKEILENSNEISEKLNAEKSLIEKDIYSLYKKLSLLRKEKALIFEKNVLDELCGLGLSNSKFKIDFKTEPTFPDCSFESENGFDDIEFLFSANSGEPLKSLSSVISGGEMSRFMLAIKAQTAKYNDIGTFIFDEIDAGLSGKTATVVAKKFADISAGAQVIAISHLPQITAMADNNLFIVEHEKTDSTLTEVKQLDIDGKIAEIVRLVGGENSDDSANSLAFDLVERANEYKKNLKK